MSIKLNGATNGSIQLDVPAAIGSDISFTLPGADGSAGQFLQTNGSGSLSLQTATQIDTSVADVAFTPNVSFIQFTNIPSTASRITFSFENLSCTASGQFELKLGNSGSFLSSGYQGSGYYFHGGSNTTMNQLSSSFTTPTASNTHFYHGQCVLTKVHDNYWSSVCTMGFDDMPLITGWAGSLDVGSTLTRVNWGWTSGDYDSGVIKMVMEHDS